MRVKLVLFVIGLMTLQIASFAQSSKPAAPPPSPSRVPAMVRVDPNQEFVTEDFTKAMRSGRPGDYLSGNVNLEGGTVPWDPIPVFVTCEGKVRYTTNADARGYFVIIPVKVPTSVTSNADGKPFARQFVGCTVEADLPGFGSSLLLIAKRNVEDNPNVGTITLSHEPGAGDVALSSTSANAPKEATKLFEKARSEWLASRWGRAEKELQKAVQIYPRFAEAWYQIGKIQEASKSPEAWGSFSKAVAADSKFALPYEHMALLAAQAENWRELLLVTTRALELNPRGTLDIWYFNALANYHLRRWDVAEASAITSLSMDPLHLQPNAEQLLGVTLAEKQDFAGALRHLRKYLAYVPSGPNSKVVKQQIAKVEAASAAVK